MPQRDQIGIIAWYFIGERMCVQAQERVNTPWGSGGGRGVSTRVTQRGVSTQGRVQDFEIFMKSESP